jgi:hypothetical protein
MPPPWGAFVILGNRETGDRREVSLGGTAIPGCPLLAARPRRPKSDLSGKPVAAR